MKRRMLPILTALVLAVGLSACAPAPSPAPTPTGFASEEEAFAAAEETYRAYVDALNAVDLSDPETFEGVYAWTTGDANAEERKSLAAMHADGWIVQGQSVVELVVPISIDATGNVTINACVNVSAIELVNAHGTSQVSPDRPRLQSLTVAISPTDSPTSLRVATIQGNDETQTCAL